MSFKFPPPPPPPPSSTSTQIQFKDDQRGRHNFRGDRGAFNHSRGGRGGFSSQRGTQSWHRGRGQIQSDTFRGRPGLSTGTKRTWSDRADNERVSKTSFGKGGPLANTRTSVAPAVPSFGFSIPTPPSQVNQLAALSGSQSPAKDKAKRKNNQLGLTPKGIEPVDSDEEIDEEAAFAAAQIVQNGQLPNIKSIAEVVAWIAERKKRYPTKARREEKTRLEREAELNRLKRKVQASRQANQSSRLPARKEDRSPKSKEDRQREKLDRHLRKAEKLRQKLATTATVTSKDAATINAVQYKQTLLGSNYDSDDSDTRAEGSNYNGDSSGSISSGSASDSDSSESSSSDDEAPEETSSKLVTTLPTTITERRPRPKEALPKHIEPWARKGFCIDHLLQKPCKHGKRCKYNHRVPQEVRYAKIPRTKLYDKLVEQEKHNENLAAVRAIQALGSTGFFKDSS